MRLYSKISIPSIVSLALYAGLFSCSDFVDIPAPRHEMVKKYVFDEERSAYAALYGLYSSMSALESSMTGTLQVAMGLYADELGLTSIDQNFEQFRQGNLAATNSYVLACWTDFYKFIYYANSILEGIENSSSLSPQVSSQIEAEARVVRALCYYYLVNLWGDVPLVISTSYQVNMVLPRTEAEKIYEQINSDLKTARELMGSNYPILLKARPNRHTAAALLARISLQQKSWNSAEEYASEVIESGAYALTTVDKTFLKESGETIWQLEPVTTIINTVIGYMLGSAIFRFPLEKSLTSIWEPADVRFSNWMRPVTASGNVHTGAYKYKIAVGRNPLNEYQVMIRLAELYLIRAEARARKDNMDGAWADLNILRQRSGLHPITEADGELLAMIEQERRRELFTEWGDRWLTLKRTGNDVQTLGVLKGGGYTSFSRLWPVPFAQLQNNPALKQNDGY